MASHSAKRSWLLFAAVVFWVATSFGQGASGTLSNRIISAQEIQKAGDQPFQRVLHYLMPDLFPKTEEAWYRTGRFVTFYVDSTLIEPDELNAIAPKDVKRILVWEQPWEQPPPEFPSLLRSRYVVSIETSRL